MPLCVFYAFLVGLYKISTQDDVWNPWSARLAITTFVSDIRAFSSSSSSCKCSFFTQHSPMACRHSTHKTNLSNMAALIGYLYIHSVLSSGEEILHLGRQGRNKHFPSTPYRTAVLFSTPSHDTLGSGNICQIWQSHQPSFSGRFAWGKGLGLERIVFLLCRCYICSVQELNKRS